MAAELSPNDGISPGSMEGSHKSIEGKAEESTATLGWDFCTPSNRAAPNSCRDAQASASHTARIRAHHRRWLPSVAHPARQKAPPRGGP